MTHKIIKRNNQHWIRVPPFFSELGLMASDNLLLGSGRRLNGRHYWKLFTYLPDSRLIVGESGEQRGEGECVNGSNLLLCWLINIRLKRNDAGQNLGDLSDKILQCQINMNDFVCYLLQETFFLFSFFLVCFAFHFILFFITCLPFAWNDSPMYVSACNIPICVKCFLFCQE